MSNESVVQQWVSSCSLKQQTVLLSALRGCDGVAKEDPSKTYTRNFRSTILLNADDKSHFMTDELTSNDWLLRTDAFFKHHIDKYPMHWLMHFLHAAEIVGRKHPNQELREYWIYFYLEGVSELHLYPETEEQCDVRLGADNLDYVHLWTEGYAATGARYHGKFLASSLRDAVTQYMDSIDTDSKASIDLNRLTMWRCKFFDNEKDARENFG